MGAGALGGAEDGAQIVGVGDLIAHHQQGRFPPLCCRGEDALHRDVLPHGGQSDDALMGVGAGNAVQLAAVGLHHHDARVPGPGGDVAQGLVRLALGNVDLVDGGAHPQGFDHRVAALDDAVGLRVRQGTAALGILHIFHGYDLIFLELLTSITQYFGEIKRHS